MAPDTGYWFVLGAFVAALVACGFLAFAPTVTTVTESVEVTVGAGGTTDEQARGSGTPQETVTQERLAESQGWGIIAGLGGPLLALTGLPLLVRSRRASIVVRWTATVLLWTFTVVGALSFGIFYFVPAMLMLGGAALALGPRGSERG